MARVAAIPGADRLRQRGRMNVFPGPQKPDLVGFKRTNLISWRRKDIKAPYL